MTHAENGSPIQRAEDLQLDACLHELGGAGPAPGLAERILAARSDRAARATARRSRWFAAAVLLAGLAVVAAVAVLHGAQEQQPAVAPPEDESQEPQGKETPEQIELAKKIERAIRLLEVPERREAATAELAGIGPAALPMLEAAIAAERKRGRDEIVAALVTAAARLTMGPAKTAFGLPDGEVRVIADYSDNRILIVDAAGKVCFSQEDVFGAWDAELTPAGTLLITEFSVSRVQEVDRKGKVVWFYEGLKNPYDADRLPNGNTLIADTFGSRVIEVNPKGEIVWQYVTAVRPFDCDRLANGNTLIADVLADRVIEVNPKGEIVWEVKNMNNVHDADRLPNGNTLITLRSQGAVVEVDPTGKVVWKLEKLTSPSDADRLPNGHTLVAENTQVREFDAAGKEVSRVKTTWAVEVNRY